MSDTPTPDASAQDAEQSTSSTDTPTPDPATGDKDWQAEAEKWKSFARKHEQQAKDNAEKARRLDELEESQKSELQKVAERAEAAERRAAEIELRAMRAEVAATKGVPVDLLTGSTVEELESMADALIAYRGAQPKPDFGAGDRGDDVKGLRQVTEAEFSRMTPQQINTARSEGRLDTILSKRS